MNEPFITYIAAISLAINAFAVPAYLIVFIRSKRWQNIALKWAEAKIDLIDTYYSNIPQAKVKRLIKESEREFKQDFND